MHRYSYYFLLRYLFYQNLMQYFQADTSWSTVRCFCRWLKHLARLALASNQPRCGRLWRAQCEFCILLGAGIFLFFSTFWQVLLDVSWTTWTLMVCLRFELTLNKICESSVEKWRIQSVCASRSGWIHWQIQVCNVSFFPLISKIIHLDSYFWIDVLSVLTGDKSCRELQWECAFRKRCILWVWVRG